MNKEIKTILKKTTKIACVTCVALGGAAMIASGAALKALAEGARFVKNNVREILAEKSDETVAEAEAIPAEETAAEEAAEAEPVAEEIIVAEEVPAAE